MAKISSVAVGKGRGSIGNVRFSIWKGIAVAAQKPESVANPRTPKQLAARSRITVCTACFRSIPTFLNLVFAALAVKQSAYNAYVAAQNQVDLLAQSGGIYTNVLDESVALYSKEPNPFEPSASYGGGATVFTLGGAVPSRSYTIGVAMENDSLVRGELVNTDVVANSGGLLSLTVPDTTTGVTSPNYLYFCVVDNVTGAKYASKLGVV